jgi:anti-sigma B factor antagonist
VSLAGECDLSARDELTSTRLAAVGTSEFVVVDPAELRFLDSSGLHALITGHHTALRRAGRPDVTNATGAVAHVLEMTGIGELLSASMGGDGNTARPT